MRNKLTWMCVLLAALLLAACGGSDDNEFDYDDGTPPETGDGSVPDPLPPGESRDGQSYQITIAGAAGEDVVFNVIEPSTLTGGETYPLVLHSHGFAGSRSEDGAAFQYLLDNGYGVISVDQRGHGDSGGTIRVMDPDFEGRNLVAVLDWAEANLGWLAYGPDLDAEGDNLKLGAIGSSYGGGYQLVLNAIDPKKRMDAMVPQITWNDLTYSLNPNGVIKAGWDLLLYTAGNTAGSGLNFDPFVTQTLGEGLLANEIDGEGQDFFRYHGNGYFCDGAPVATNGGEGTSPDFAANPPGGVNALFWQGMRDTLFNFNEAYWNYQCLNDAGGDVRLLSYQSGHNSIPAIPDLSALLELDPLFPVTAFDTDCGGWTVEDATLAFFDKHLKGVPDGETGADGIPEVCLSLDANDDLVLDSVPAGQADGVELTVPQKTVTTVLTPRLPRRFMLDYDVAQGEVLAGVPYAELTIEPCELCPENPQGEPILFIGVGKQSIPGSDLVYELVDNQLTPVRGYGTHQIDLTGVGERLQADQRLALLAFTDHEQYLATGNLSIGGIFDLLGSALQQDADEGGLLDLPVKTVQVSGSVWLPLREPEPE